MERTIYSRTANDKAEHREHWLNEEEISTGVPAFLVINAKENERLNSFLYEPRFSPHFAAQLADAPLIHR